MAHIIAIANQKGGVGKTTSTANISAGLAAAGKRVLMVDIDPQASLTKRYGDVDPRRIDTEKKTIYYGLVKDDDTGATRPLSEIIFGDNPALIPSNIKLSTANNEILVGAYFDKYNLLRKKLAEIKGRFDYILIDCPPNMDLLMANALCAAHGVLIPSIMDFDSLLGVEDLLKLVMDIKSEVNHDLEIIGVLPTIFEERHTVDRQYLDELRALMDGYTIFPPVARSTRYKQGTETGLATLITDPHAPGVDAYRRVVDHLIKYYE